MVTGSVTVEYDPAQVSRAALLAALALPPGSARDRGVLHRAPARAPTARQAADGDGPAAALRFLAITGTVAATLLPVGGAVRMGLLVAAGLPAFARTVRGIVARRRLTGDALEAGALLLLVARSQFAAAGLLAWLRAAGDYLVARTTSRARQSLRASLLSPTRAVWRIEDGQRVQVTAGDLRVGDVLLVAARQPLLVDGRVIDGEALVDQQTMTGEGLPVERRAGDPVFAATIVEEGEIAVLVQRLGSDTTLGRIVRAVEAAAAEKTEIQVVAEDLADRRAPRTLLLALLGAAVARSLDAGLAIVAGDQAMAARVGIPVAVAVPLARAAASGILVKGTRALEQLARVDTVVFDKTGTLTVGAPHVRRVLTYDPRWSVEDIVRLTAAAERGTRHPIARAIARLAAERGLIVPRPTAVAVRVGWGVDVVVDTTRVLVGSRRFLEDRRVDVRDAADDEHAAHASGAAVTFVAIDGRLAAMLVLEDALRADAPEALAALLARDVRDVVMLSGDHLEPTRRIAESLGIRRYHADLLPEDKAALIRQLKAEGRVVAMVGDGVNDALALDEADVGIAVRAEPDVVAAAADIVLRRGGLAGVVRALDLARSAVTGIERALAIATHTSLAVVGLASLGLARPVLAILLTRGAPVGAALVAAAPGRPVARR
jgi:Cu2+-exporting ATPase